MGADVHVTGPTVNAESPKVKGEGGIHLPSFGFGKKSPKADVDVDVDVDGKADTKHRFGFDLPKFGFGGSGKKKKPKIDASLDAGADVDVDMPKGGVSGDIAIAGPHVDVDVDKPDVKVKGEMPKVELGGGVDADLHVDKPDADVDVKVGSPDISVDVDKPDLDGKGEGKFKFKGPKFGLPKFGFGGSGKAKADVDAGVDVSVEQPSPPHVEGEVKVEGPHVDIDVDKPKEKHEGKFKIHLPKFGSKGKADVGGELPSGKVGADVSVEPPSPPHVGADVEVKGPKVDIDVDKPDVDLGADVKVTGPSVDVDSPKLKGEGGGKFDVHLPKFGFGKKSPKADVDVDVDIDGKAGKDTKHGFGFDLPKFGFGGSGKAKGKVDAGLDVGADVDVKVPKGAVGGDVAIAGPHVDVDIDKPDVKVKGEMPKVDLGGGVDADLHVDKPGADVDVKVGSPDISVDVDKPDLDGKGEGKFKFKGPKFGLPKFGFGGSGKAKADVDAGLPSGEAGVDVSVEQPSPPHVGAEVEVEAPKVDIDVDKPDVKTDSKFKIHMPKFGFGKGKADAGATLPMGEAGADVSAELPSGKMGVEVSVEQPKADVQADVDVDGKVGARHGFGFDLPKFGFAGSGKKKGKVDASLDAGAGVKGGMPSGDIALAGPRVDVNIDKPEVKAKGELPNVEVGGGVDADLHVDRPDADVDVKVGSPDVNVDVDKPDLDGKGEGKFKFKGPKFGLPKFGFGGGSGKAKADVDAGLPSGEAGADVSAELPSGKMGVDVSVEQPKAGVQADVDVDGKVGARHGFGFDLPKFGFAGGGKKKGKVGASLDADVKVDAPSGHVAIAGPHVDVDVDKPDGGVEIQVPKAELGAGVDADLDVDRPGIEGGVKVEGPRVDIGVDKPEVKKDAKFKIHMPRFGSDKRKADIGAEVPSGKVDADVSVEHPKADVQADVGTRRGFGFELPKFGFGGSGKAKGKVDVDVGGPRGDGAGDITIVGPSVDVDIDKPSGELGADVSVQQPSPLHVEGGVKVEGPHVDLDVDKPKGKKEGKFKIHMPKLGTGGKGKAEIDADVPSGKVVADVSVEQPKADVHGDVDVGTRRGFGFDLPKLGFGGSGKATGKVNGSLDAGADVKVDVPKGDVDIDKPDVKLKVHEPDVAAGISIDQPSPPHVGGEVKVKGPKVDVDVDEPDVKTKSKFKFHMPKLGSGKGKADVDAKLPSGEVGGDVTIDQPSPPRVEGDIKVGGPKVDIDLDKPEFKTDSDFSWRMPELGFTGPDFDIDFDQPKRDDKFETSYTVGPRVPYGMDTHVTAQGPSGGLEGGFGVAAPKVKLGGDVDVDRPSDFDVRLKGDVPDADVNLSASGEVPSVKIDDQKKSKTKDKTGMKIDFPKFGFGKKSGVDRDLEVGAATAYVDADVKQPSADIRVTAAPDAHVDVPSPRADADVKVEKRSFGGKMKGIFSHKDAKGGYSASSPSAEGEVRLEAPTVHLDSDVSGEGKVDVTGREAAIDVPSHDGAEAELRLPSARLDVGADAGATPKRRSSADAEVRLRKPGDRPHSTIEGGARFAPPKSEGRRTGSLERHAHKPEYGARLSWSIGRKKPDKPKKNIEMALRMGLPIVSVAAGNFGDDESRSTDHKKTASVELAKE